MSHNINAYLSCLRMLVSVERYPESGRFPITSFKGTSCWGRKIAVFYDYLSTAFSWRTVEYSKNTVQDEQVVPLLNTNPPTTTRFGAAIIGFTWRTYLLDEKCRCVKNLPGLHSPAQPPIGCCSVYVLESNQYSLCDFYFFGSSCVI